MDNEKKQERQLGCQTRSYEIVHVTSPDRPTLLLSTLCINWIFGVKYRVVLLTKIESEFPKIVFQKSETISD